MSVKAYFQPSCREGLQEALAKMGAESKIVAGGTDFMVKHRTAPRDYREILSLSCMREMSLIQERSDKCTISIGAMATHSEIASDPLIRTHFPALAMACNQVGSVQIRNRGTIGGNLANASAAGDLIPVLYLLGASIEIFDKEGNLRTIPVEELILQPGRTNLRQQEVIWAILLPLTDCNSYFVKLGARKEVTIADISMCMLWKTEGGRFTSVKSMIGAVDGKPIEPVQIYKDFIGKRMEEVHLPLIAKKLQAMITEIRLQRKTSSRLRLTDAEKLYKERAIKGVFYDLMTGIGF